MPKSCVDVLKLPSQLKGCASWMLLVLKEITVYKAIVCSGSNIFKGLHPNNHLLPVCIHTKREKERDLTNVIGYILGNSRKTEI